MFKKALLASYELITTHRVTTSENRVRISEEQASESISEPNQFIKNYLLPLGLHKSTSNDNARSNQKKNPISLFVDTRGKEQIVVEFILALKMLDQSSTMRLDYEENREKSSILARFSVLFSFSRAKDELCYEKRHYFPDVLIECDNNRNARRSFHFFFFVRKKGLNYGLYLLPVLPVCCRPPIRRPPTWALCAQFAHSIDDSKVQQTNNNETNETKINEFSYRTG